MDRYDQCKVADKLNWYCKFNDGSGWFAAYDGRLDNQDESSGHISYVEYLMLSWGLIGR